MPRRAQLDQLKAKEQAAKAALEVQRKALKAAQAKRKAAEQKLLQVRWQEIGRLADQAGLATLDLDVLPAAFAYLATLAQDPDQVKHWRNDTSERYGTMLHSACCIQPRTHGGMEEQDQGSLPSFSFRETLHPGSEPSAHDRNLGREKLHGDVSI